MSQQTHRPRLGRGLSSLIRNSTISETVSPENQSFPEPSSPDVATNRRLPIQTAAGGIIMVAISDLMPNPSQPRHRFEEQALAELTESIRLHGVLQPILIARTPEGEISTPYRLIAGERRLRAAELAGLAEVPCIVRPASSREMLELSLIENLRRADLNPVERAKAYRDLMDRFCLTQEEVAKRMGEPRATIANYLRLLDLCDFVQALIITGSVSFGHAKVLAGLAGKPEFQTRLAQKVAKENISVRQLEELVKSAQLGKLPPAARNITPKPAYLADVEKQLTRTVGTKVTIRPGRAKNSGRIVIEYYSLDDFDKIVTSIGAKIES
ncbi:MAG: ParB/RepB/Spo0J family partition protein [Planctomycetota bacterium]|nr:ParB/RepB/Spo0J family partition protein [Planctomycetota bacterium]